MITRGILRHWNILLLKLEIEQKKTKPNYAAERDSRAGGPMDQLVLHQIVQGEKNSSRSACLFPFTQLDQSSHIGT